MSIKEKPLVPNQVVITRDKRRRLQFYCKCAVCGRKKIRYVKENRQVGTGKKNWERKKKVKGGDVFDTVAGTAADTFLRHGIPWMAKKTFEMGRYGTIELMRNENLQKKAANYGINKLTPFIQDSFGTALDPLSTKVRPNLKYKTDRPFNHWTPFPTVKCPNGDKLQDF